MRGCGFPRKPTHYPLLTRAARALAITTINISNQLEEFKANPDIYNATMLPQLGVEKVVSMDRIRCETLHGRSMLNIYVIEITENKNEISKRKHIWTFPIITDLPYPEGRIWKLIAILSRFVGKLLRPALRLLMTD
jgi:hypothetical protein